MTGKPLFQLFGCAVISLNGVQNGFLIALREDLLTILVIFQIEFRVYSDHNLKFALKEMKGNFQCRLDDLTVFASCYFYFHRSRNILDDFREAYFWLRQNTPDDARYIKSFLRWSSSKVRFFLDVSFGHLNGFISVLANSEHLHTKDSELCLPNYFICRRTIMFSATVNLK